MIKVFLTSLLLAITLLSVTAQETKILSKYNCRNGWQIKRNGSLILGYPTSAEFKTILNSEGNGLPETYRDSILIVSALEQGNMKKVYATIRTSLGEYHIAIEAAINSRELQVPDGFSNSSMQADLEAEKARYEGLIDSIPFKNGKIFYDEIVSVKGIDKDALFVLLRQWMVEEFKDSKAVLEVNDKDKGLLTGKGTYKYTTITGLNSTEGWVTYIINIAAKDDKFRYQLYGFSAKGMRSDFNPFAVSGSDKSSETFDMDDVWNKYNNGSKKDIKEAKKYLIKMIWLTEQISYSISRIGSKNFNDISDF